MHPSMNPVPALAGPSRLMAAFQATLAAILLSAGCSGPYTYTSYEVIRRADRLHAGDDVRVVPLEGEPYQGRLTGLADGRLTIALSGDRERTIAWSDIHVIERILEVKAR